MIQVVKQGHKYFQTTCGACGCVFKFEDDDIESRNELGDRGMVWAVEWTLTCPCCHKKVSLTDQQAEKLW